MPERDLERVRAVFDRARIALTLADLSKPDAPLILANPAFEALTGYAPSVVMGRNCRFLQAGLEEENAIARAEIRRALAAGTEAQTILRNRRADGAEFDNLLFLHPIGGIEGTPRFMLGSQFRLRDRTMAAAQGAARHAVRLSGELAQVAARTERLQLSRSRTLADGTALVVRAWVRGAPG